jgi:hypothetical protein
LSRDLQAAVRSRRRRSSPLNGPGGRLRHHPQGFG